MITLSLLVVSTALTATSLTTPRGDELVGPPGLAEVEGGKTKIGVDAKEIVPIIEETRFTKLVGETPKHDVKVDDFFLMVTEATNEQYRQFVETTGSKPPRSWAEAAINTEIAAFNEREGLRIKELREQGTPPHEIVRQKFDAAAQARWWDENWSDQEYGVPEGKSDHPVVFVSYGDSVQYARWAGLRLMTEEEFQRAGRGDTDRAFVWGENFELAFCATVERNVDSTHPVGSFPDGATPQGIHDLCGNVWEWTSSPYVAYPKYKPLSVKIGGHKETALATWDANQRVAVSGCYKTPKEAARLTVRRATERFQATDSMGLRCASSKQPGLDVAEAVIDQDVSVYVVPEGVTYDPQLVVAMERWESRTGTATVDGYQIITAYHDVMFIPVSKIEHAGLKPLSETSVEEGPVHMGVLSTSLPLTEPALAPGTYMVAWRAKGESKKAKEEEPEAEEGDDEPEATDDDTPTSEDDPPQWDTRYDTWIFYDVEGEFVASMRARGIQHERLKPGTVAVAVKQPSDEQKEYGVLPWDQVDLVIPVPGKTSSRGFSLKMSLRMKEGTVTGDTWRMSAG